MPHAEATPIHATNPHLYISQSPVSRRWFAPDTIVRRWAECARFSFDDLRTFIQLGARIPGRSLLAMEQSQQQQVVAQIERATPRHAVLAAEEAWAIANEFRTGRVGVVEDKSAPMSVIKSYEWVTLNCDSRMGSTESDEAAARRLGDGLRALRLTWTLLSRCPGYGGDENPAFWKLLLDNQPSIDEMTDAVHFFRHNTFPSFKLCKMN